MVLYFPVSALVTLFGNILQNPLDPRARSDTKLMNVVVNFLTTLGPEAETGGVHRMLGVCSEFERIAKAVVDNAEKEHASRRKRKNQDPSADGKPSTGPIPKPPNSPSFKANAGSTPGQTPRPTTSSSATPQASHGTRHLSPPTGDHRSPPTGFSPMTTSMSQSPSPGLAPQGWAQDFTVNQNGDTLEFTSFADFTGFGAIGNMNGVVPTGPGIQSPPLAGGFQQPMLPPDLFNLPSTLDWDWAEMSNGAYPSVENGNFGQPGP